MAIQNYTCEFSGEVFYNGLMQFVSRHHLQIHPQYREKFKRTKADLCFVTEKSDSSTFLVKELGCLVTIDNDDLKKCITVKNKKTYYVVNTGLLEARPVPSYVYGCFVVGDPKLFGKTSGVYAFNTREKSKMIRKLSRMAGYKLKVKNFKTAQDLDDYTIDLEFRTA